MALGAAFEGRGEPAYKPLYRGHPDFGRHDDATPETIRSPGRSVLLIRDRAATVGFHPSSGGGYFYQNAAEQFDLSAWCRSGEFDIAAINAVANQLRLREAELVYVEAPIADHWTKIVVQVEGGEVHLAKV